MNLAWCRFYEELNDFLPYGKKDLIINKRMKEFVNSVIA